MRCAARKPYTARGDACQALFEKSVGRLRGWLCGKRFPNGAAAFKKLFSSLLTASAGITMYVRIPCRENTMFSSPFNPISNSNGG